MEFKNLFDCQIASSLEDFKTTVLPGTNKITLTSNVNSLSCILFVNNDDVIYYLTSEKDEILITYKMDLNIFERDLKMIESCKDLLVELKAMNAV